MRYDLQQMVKLRRPGRRKAKPIRMRSAPLGREESLYRIYKQIITFWRGRIRHLEPPYQVMDAMPQPSQIEASQVEANLLASALIQQLNDWVMSSGDWTRKLWVGRIKNEFGIDLDFIATNQAGQEELRAAVEWAAALIRDLNDSMRNKLVGVLASSVSNGLEPAEVALEVKKVLDIGDSRARLIARDQCQKIFAKLNELQQREAGLNKYVWNHSFQPNPRRHHVERQGNIYTWSRPPRGGHPGTEINCRCTASAVVEM